MINGGQDAHLVYRIVLLFGAQLRQAHLKETIIKFRGESQEEKQYDVCLRQDDHDVANP